jgi:ribulose-phosphate 3-epimerase
MSTKTIAIAPSILAADFARLGDQVREAERDGVDRIHVDVMDGHFVPNISIGPLVVAALRPVTDLPLECHLMIADPDRYIEAFVQAGADSIIVHFEGNNNLHRTVHHIQEFHKKAGVAINPATPCSALDAIIADLDLVLVMTVNPGFGGQKFIRSTLDKIRTVQTTLDRVNPACDLEVDGGIDGDTAPLVVEAGANALVAGTSIFGHRRGIAAGIDELKRASIQYRVV